MWSGEAGEGTRNGGGGRRRQWMSGLGVGDAEWRNPVGRLTSFYLGDETEGDEEVYINQINRLIREIGVGAHHHHYKIYSPLPEIFVFFLSIRK